MGGAVWSIHLMGTNALEITYLLLAAFAVGRHSRFDHHLLRSAPPAFCCLLEGELAAVSLSVLGL